MKKPKKVTALDMLKRLLKAEHNEYAGVIGRQGLREVADAIRLAIRPKKKG